MKRTILFLIAISSLNLSVSYGNLNLEKAGCLKMKDKRTRFKYEHELLGKFSICQSKREDKIIFFKSKKKFLDNKFCFIPTHEKGNKSFYIGEPRCLFLNDNEKVFRISFLKNRPGNYKDISINGTLIIPDKFIHFSEPFDKEIKMGVPEAYLRCMKEINSKTENIAFCEVFKKANHFIYVPLDKK
jgi:hypothetical protein